MRGKKKSRITKQFIFPLNYSSLPLREFLFSLTNRSKYIYRLKNQLMKQKLKPFSFLVFTFFYFISFGQYNLKDPLPVDPTVKVGKLPNGLTYYIRKNVKPEKKLELRLAVNAGSVLESNDQRGLCL